MMTATCPSPGFASTGECDEAYQSCSPPPMGPLSIGVAFPSFQDSSSHRRSCTSRRVIFPSLHAAEPSTVERDVTLASAEPERTLSSPVTISPHPLTPDPSPSGGRSSCHDHFPALSASERERLLSRLDSPIVPLSPDGSRFDGSGRRVVSNMHTLCYDALMAPSLKLQAATRTVLPMTPLLGRGRAALASGKRKDSPPPQLFSLMLPSFDYLIHSSPNDYPDEPQENPCSPVLMSTLRPQRSMSPPPSPPPASLVPILRRSTRIAAVPPSASEVAASEEGKSTVMIVSDEEEDEALSDDVPSLASSLSSESLLMEDADTPMLPCSSDHSSHSQSSAPSSSSSAASSSSDYNFPPSLPRVTRNRSEGSAVSFCPRVWVRIFERSARERDRIWYTPSDMEGFKREALERVQQYYDHQRSCQATAPTGSRRVGVAPTSAPAARLLFSHQALQVECDVLSSDGGPASVEPEEEKEVRRVLVVDPHSACLDLLCRAFRLLFPRADVHAASRTDEALAHLRSHERWDVVAVEERLAVHGPAVGVGKDRRNSSMEISGSALLQGIKEKVSCAPPPLFIGITSHLEQDQERFRNAGADLVWPKPPPSVSHELREGLLRSLLRKRGKDRQSSP